MLDINQELKKSLKNLEVKTVFQYPDSFVELPIVSYYTVSDKIKMFVDNGAFIEEGYINLDIWTKTPKEGFDIAQAVNSALDKDGWIMQFMMDVKKESDENIYHRTMRFKKQFVII